MPKIIQPSAMFLDTLGDLPLFRGLARIEQEALFHCAKIYTCQPGELLFSEGDLADGFFILKSGRVKMRRITHTGREVVLHLSAPPHMIGCKGLTLPGSTYPADAVALDPVIALCFTRESFLAQAAKKPDLFFSLLINLNVLLSEIYTMQAVLSVPTEQRIATLLFNQALPEDRLPDAAPIPVSLTKSLIASIVGTTTETAIRILSRWKKAGLIGSERGKIQLHRPEVIWRIAEGMSTPTCHEGADCSRCGNPTCPSLRKAHQLPPTRGRRAPASV